MVDVYDGYLAAEASGGSCYRRCNLWLRLALALF